jgi:alkanesulfonate monooxygenase SsuD/methylene tetrahydromethanopterin reductase-like flavin-dependent oxidoreductase (luciferase family)
MSASAPPKFALVFGLDTFGDVTHDDDDRSLSHAQTIRNLVEQGVLADELGVDFFGIGEHHTDDFPLSAADVVLAAIAARTARIRVGSAVTVLSSDDPVRVFQRYSTLDAVSGGRAEVILGRGSSVDSFPLFGYDLADYEELFDEEEFWPHYLEVIRHASRTRGFAVPTKDSFMHEIGPRGALHVGSPETVARKIADTLTVTGANRFDLKYGMGGLSQRALMTNIELYGTEVVPRVRELLPAATTRAFAG